MSLIVQKFGGSSVRDKAHLLRACEIMKKAHERGDQVVAVLSAQGDTTDELLARARAFGAEPSSRELDALLATGECASVALGALALRSLGVDAVSLAGWQVEIRTDALHGSASIESVNPSRIRRELEAGKIVLVAGFQGVDDAGDITTLGRGGSDTSAVALAARLHAERCEIYTDVDGVYTTDPRICPAARHLDAVSYDHMLRLAAHGAQVLHDRCVALAARHGVELTVLSCEEGSRVTRICAHADCGEVTGVTRRRDEKLPLTRISTVGWTLPSKACERAACAALADAGINVFGVEEGEQRLSLLVGQERADEALCIIHDVFF